MGRLAGLHEAGRARQGWSCNQVFEGHSHYVMQARPGSAPPYMAFTLYQLCACMSSLSLARICKVSCC